MDTLTHIVLGACIGEATAGKILGRKAMVAGAMAQSIPDIDFIAYFWLGKTENLLAHRGFTHSIIFAVLVVAVLSAASRKIFHKRKFTWRQGILLFGINVFCHLFIDAFNAYGVGWLEPFFDNRFSFNILFVADPLFSIWPFVGMLLIIIYFRKMNMRSLGWKIGLGMSALYLMYAVINKLEVNDEIRRELSKQKIEYQSFISTPSPFNTWLWFVMVKNKDGYYTAYRSVFDNKPLDLTFNPRNDHLLQEVREIKAARNLLRFAQGYYTFERMHDTIAFNILRFGKQAGWYDKKAKFAFYYYFDKPGSNEFLVQRGRFKNWNRQTLNDFLRRIRGD
ncbi:MAG: metal-dependent hydrolase [Chitinophagaceae bacterium]